MFLCRWLPQRGKAFSLAEIIARVAGEILPRGRRAYAKGIAKPRSFIPVLRRRGDALVTGFNSDQQSFESEAVPECESDKNSYGELGRFRGAGQPAFEAFFISRFRKIRKTTPTLMRGHASHRPMPATACSASLRCRRSRYTRPSRSPGDDV